MWIRIHDTLEENVIDTILANPYKTKIIAVLTGVSIDALVSRGWMVFSFSSVCCKLLHACAPSFIEQSPNSVVDAKVFRGSVISNT